MTSNHDIRHNSPITSQVQYKVHHQTFAQASGPAKKTSSVTSDQLKTLCQELRRDDLIKRLGEVIRNGDLVI